MTYETNPNLKTEDSNPLDTIAQLPHVSDVREARRRLVRQAARGELTVDEIDATTAALSKRREELIIPTGTDPTLAGPEREVDPQSSEWTPSSVLSRMDLAPREADWRERQLPTGDRD